jgi:hypothetical protein
LTGFKITDAIELEDGEPPISPDLCRKIKGFDPLTALDRLCKESELPNSQCTIFLLIHGSTAYLIGLELIECLVNALMRWTLGSELTTILHERNMHDMITLGVGYLDKMPTRILEPNMTSPVYISEPLVALSLSSLFEQWSWTSGKTSMIRSFRTAPNHSVHGYLLETVLLLVLMEVFGGKFSPLANAFHCSKSLGSRRATLVSLRRVADGVMQSCPVSWKTGSSDRLALRAKSPTDVLTFLDNPDGKAFLFPDNHMGSDLFCFLQDEETKELILLAIQSKALPTLDAETWRSALNSVTPQFFYTVLVGIILCNPHQYVPLF